MNDTDDIHDFLLLKLPYKEYTNGDHLCGGSFGLYRVDKYRSYPGYNPCFTLGRRSLNNNYCINFSLGYANEYFKPFRDIFSWVAY
jgi:hypothetical protein